MRLNDCNNNGQIEVGRWFHLYFGVCMWKFGDSHRQIKGKNVIEQFRLMSDGKKLFSSNENKLFFRLISMPDKSSPNIIFYGAKECPNATVSFLCGIYVINKLLISATGSAFTEPKRLTAHTTKKSKKQRKNRREKTKR